MLRDIGSEDLDWVCAFLATDPGQPSVAGGNVCNFIMVDDLQCVDAGKITVESELLDSHWVHIETACFVNQSDDADSGPQIVRCLLCR